MKEPTQSFYNSPLELIKICAGKNGLSALTFLPIDAPKTSLSKTSNIADVPGFDLIRQVVKELDVYFLGTLKQFFTEIDWGQFSDFQHDLLALTARIPFGEVWSYGELARKLGKPNAARAVGNALGSNPLLILIPCHRVIGSDRCLHGYAGGVDKKAFLLRLEGHQIIGDRVIQAV